MKSARPTRSAALLDRPRKPLQLELEQGCADRAVLGGLSAFLRTWAAALEQADQPAAPLAREIAAAFGDYATAPLKQRRSLVAWALGQLAGDPPQPAPPPPPPPEPPPPLTWDSPVTALTGVGPQRAELLLGLGLETVGDLLCYYPSAYEDRSDLATLADARHREPIFTRVTITERGRVEYRGSRRAVIPARDESGLCSLVWVNQAYLVNQYSPGDALLVRGQARCYPQRLEILVQRCERAPAEAETGVVPVYATTEGVSPTWLRELIVQALERCPERPAGLIPVELAQERGLAPLSAAVAEMHHPTDLAAATAARHRLAYESLFLLQAQLARRRQHQRRPLTGCRITSEGLVERWQEALPYPLTGAQRRAIDEILGDLDEPYPAQRLLHGDVGSGKTAVAGAALLAAALAGRQAALMAPTELLAEQHYRTLSELLRPFDLRPALLTGSAPAATNAAVRRALASGEARLVIGTHALFSQEVRFADLALVVVDEQHRFGVRQRAHLAAKGVAPHLLVMSATPIPRTLALTAYGDFEVSVLDELPPGRRPVHTQVLSPRQRRRAYSAIVDHVLLGRRAFVVCPVIGEGKKEYLVPAEDLYERLSREVPGLRWGLVHGRLAPAEREQTMDRFRRGDLDALIATSVVEVGVDVPEATLMIVENAERFGLAQLHQLRGRVARAVAPAACYLITGSPNPEVLTRLQLLERTGDGFELAQEDLIRRGPGELFGDRQHGYLDVRIAEFAADTRVLLQARGDAFALLAADPELAQPAHEPLRQALERTARREETWTL
ncbi:MAG TPA: ATP-dependent DNA helicase RecG [Armatimonadota bacterium]|jgi:ATP-dependent DNA helicase RecG